MKSMKEILTMLIHELVSHFDKVKSINQNLDYYNDILGDTSFLLSNLLESLLRNNFKDWNNRKWMDDSIITSITVQNNKLAIGGIMIWGKKGTTEQWTDPFFFEIDLLRDKTGFKKFTFLFCDMYNHEITYEQFKANRNYWTKGIRNWRYIIDSNKNLADNI